MRLLLFVLIVFAVFPAAMFFISISATEREERLRAIKAGVGHFGPLVTSVLAIGIVLNWMITA